MWRSSSERLLCGLAILCTAAAAVGFCSIPIESILRDWSSDDSFYYATVARRFAAGEGSTFDGVQPTNGYHPLWMLCQVPVHWLFADRESALRATKVLEVLLGLLSFVLVQCAIRRTRLQPIVAALPLLLLVKTGLLYQGIETILLVATACGVLLALQRFMERPTSTSRWTLSAALLLVVLARLEALALVPWIVWHAGSGGPGSRERWSTMGRLLVLPAFGLAAYAVINQVAIGSAVPISGIVKGWWSHGRSPATLASFVDHVAVLARSGQVRDGLLWGGVALGAIGVVRWRRCVLVPGERAALAFLCAMAVLHAARLAWFGWTTSPPFGSYAHYWVVGRVLRYSCLLRSSVS